MQNLLALKKICINSCFSTYSVFLFLSCNFLLTFSSYANLFNSSFFHQFLSSHLNCLFLFPFLLSLSYFPINFSALHLKYYSLSSFTNSYLLFFALPHSLFILSFFLSFVFLHWEFPITFPHNTSLRPVCLPCFRESQRHLGWKRSLKSLVQVMS